MTVKLLTAAPTKSSANALEGSPETPLPLASVTFAVTVYWLPGIKVDGRALVFKVAALMDWEATVYVAVEVN